jgi:hypothetical protein
MAINTPAAQGSIPQHRQPVEAPGWKALFHSEREIALILDKTVKQGFGVLKAGTLMSLVNGGDQLVPYPTTDPDNIVAARAFGLADIGSTDDAINVTMEDSYKFSVGDVVMLANNNGGGDFHDGGAITAIDRTTYPNYAVITFTTALDTNVNMTVANAVNIYHKGDTAESDGVEANYILDKDIDTGAGEKAAGGLASVVVSNAVLNYGNLINLDAGAIVDLGAVADGTRFLILK